MLHIAIGRTPAAVPLLLSGGANALEVKEGCNALERAAVRHDLQSLEFMVKHVPGASLGYRGHKSGFTLLHHACLYAGKSVEPEQYLPIIQRLLAPDSGLTAAVTDRKGHTPLHVLIGGVRERMRDCASTPEQFAAHVFGEHRGLVDIITWLSNSSSIMRLDKSGSSPFMLAFARRAKDTRLQALQESAVPAREAIPVPLSVLCCMIDVATAKSPAALAGPIPSSPIWDYATKQAGPLTPVFHYCDLKLSTSGDSASDADGRAAIRRWVAELVGRLLSHGLPVNGAAYGEGCTPPLLLALSCCREAVPAIIAAGAELFRTYTYGDTDGDAAIHAAARVLDVEMVVLLAEEMGRQMPNMRAADIRNVDHQNALTIAAGAKRPHFYAPLCPEDEAARLAVMKALIERFGASVNNGVADSSSWTTPLAAACGALVHPCVIELLLSHGADPMAGEQPALDAMGASLRLNHLPFRAGMYSSHDDDPLKLACSDQRMATAADILRLILTQSQYPVKVRPHHFGLCNGPDDAQTAVLLINAGASPVEIPGGEHYFSKRSYLYRLLQGGHLRTLRQVVPVILSSPQSGLVTAALSALSMPRPLASSERNLGYTPTTEAHPVAAFQELAEAVAAGDEYFASECRSPADLVEMASLLLQLGLPVDAHPAEGHTLLATAVCQRNAPLTSLLLQRGANVHQRVNPMHLLLFQKVTFARLLSRYGDGWLLDNLGDCVVNGPTLLQLLLFPAPLRQQSDTAAIDAVAELLLEHGYQHKTTSAGGMSLIGAADALLRAATNSPTAVMRSELGDGWDAVGHFAAVMRAILRHHYWPGLRAEAASLVDGVSGQVQTLRYSDGLWRVRPYEDQSTKELRSRAAQALASFCWQLARDLPADESWGRRKHAIEARERLRDAADADEG